ncbi:MAG: HEPN domain-containing protein [Candidatus Uhrbacteria bacterium]
MTPTPFVADWFKRANEDIGAAALMLDEGSFPNPICFHAQQSVEKALKGYLAANEVRPEKTHDLLELLTACANFDTSFNSLRDDAQYLKRFYIEARYPGDFPSYTLGEAQKAYDAAKRIHSFVENRLGSCGADMAA